jgi:hypothetical protein
MRTIAALALAATALAGCTPNERPTAGPIATASAWQTVATPADRERLRSWRQVFVQALSEAQAAGHGPAIAREGALLQPDSAIGGGLPDGDYRCRMIKLGTRSPGMLPFIAYPAFNCRVTPAGRLQTFAKLTGSQRQVGSIFAHDQLRHVFLGSLVLGDEQKALPYGADSDRDLAGWVERIGERRWRIILPSPRYESLTDIIELVPA